MKFGESQGPVKPDAKDDPYFPEFTCTTPQVNQPARICELNGEGALKTSSSTDPAVLGVATGNPAVAVQKTATEIGNKADEIDQLEKSKMELEERGKKLEEIREVLEEQAVLRDKIKELESRKGAWGWLGL